ASIDADACANCDRSRSLARARLRDLAEPDQCCVRFGDAVKLRRVGALDGKTAIVTGASSGIGASTARALALEGARVAGGARRTDRLETDVRLELDVTDPESSARFVERAVEELGGGIDILFNNAGLRLG